MKCDLTKKVSMNGNKVGYVRSYVSGRTHRKFHPNLHKTFFSTPELGGLTLTICAATKKTIDKYGGIIKFLLEISENQLSTLGLSLKNKILKFYKKKLK